MKKLYILIGLLSISFSTFSQVGINTTTPNAQLEIKSSNQTTPSNTDGILIPKIDAFPITNPTAVQDGMMVYLTQTVGVNQAGFYFWKNSSSSWMSINGILSENDPQVSSTTANTIPKYNGTTLVDGLIIDNGTNVGVGITPTPGNKLHVDGKTLTSILEVTNKTTTDRFRMINGAFDKYVLQSDPNGNTTWVNPNTLLITETDPQVLSSSINSISKYNGTALVDGVMIDDGTNVGVGIIPTTGNKLEVAGKIKTTNLQMTNGATANYVLQSDAAGNASWVNNNGGYTHYLGELYLGGVIFELHKEADGLEHGLVISTTQGSGVWQTINSTTGADRSEDGAYNTNLITNSPIQTFVTSLGTGWYLPSKDEMRLIINNVYLINKVLRANGFNLIEYQYYHWTSTEANIDNAIRWDSAGLFSPNFKNAPSRFLGIKKF